MPSRVRILTPENVELSYELAGLGSRFMAVFADTLIQTFCLLVIVLGIAAAGYGRQWLGIRFSTLDSWVIAIFVLLGFLIFWFYYVFFETKWNGQTPGKKSVGIRVIRDGGYPVDFRSALIRNLVRFIDFFPPGTYAVGILSIFLSSHHKRLGDYAAGTIVIKERGKEDAVPTVVRPRAQPVLLDDSMTVNISRLTVDDYRAVRHFLERRSELALGLAQDLARRIAAPLIVKLGRDPNTMPLDAIALLEEIASAFEAKHRM